MRQETSNRAIQNQGFGLIALAALAGAVALLAAGPARANNEFQNGFEDQLGRIAAYGAVNLGLQLLTGGYYPVVVPVPVAPVVQASYYGPRYAPYYGPRRVVVVNYPKAHRHGKYCNARNGYHGQQYGYRDDDRGHGKSYRGGHGRGW